MPLSYDVSVTLLRLPMHQLLHRQTSTNMLPHRSQHTLHLVSSAQLIEKPSPWHLAWRRSLIGSEDLCARVGIPDPSVCSLSLFTVLQMASSKYSPSNHCRICCVLHAECCIVWHDCLALHMHESNGHPQLLWSWRAMRATELYLFPCQLVGREYRTVTASCTELETRGGRGPTSWNVWKEPSGKLPSYSSDNLAACSASAKGQRLPRKELAPNNLFGTTLQVISNPVTTNSSWPMQIHEFQPSRTHATSINHILFCHLTARDRPGVWCGSGGHGDQLMKIEDWQRLLKQSWFAFQKWSPVVSWNPWFIEMICKWDYEQKRISLRCHYVRTM